jgi:hypothetical protein
MWICLNDAFLSAVQDRDNVDRLCVRARKYSHLQHLFPETEIVVTPHADYACRVFVTKHEFAQMLIRKVGEIQYTNFKNSVRERALHDLYSEFWLQHRAYQQAGTSPDRRGHLAWASDDVEHHGKDRTGSQA